jgi:prepilin-type N-terminal cleavage/methylation domain-containing protein
MKFKLARAFSLIELSIVVLIIGILIAGVTQGSRLVKQSKIKTAQNQTYGSPVSSIPGLVMWLETTMDNSLTSTTNGNVAEDGDSISGWNDQNTQDTVKNNATQGISINQPKYIVNGINSLPAIYFNGTNSFLNVSGNIVANPTYSIIMVVERTASTSGPTLGGNFGNRGIMVGYTGSTSAIIHDGTGGGSDWSSYTIPAYTSPVAAITTFTYDTSRNTTLYINGTSYGAQNRVIYAYPSGYYIGSNANGYSLYTGYIGEIIIFNRTLKNSERQIIESYLAKKWEINCCII